MYAANARALEHISPRERILTIGDDTLFIELFFFLGRDSVLVSLKLRRKHSDHVIIMGHSGAEVVRREWQN